MQFSQQRRALVRAANAAALLLTLFAQPRTGLAQSAAQGPTPGGAPADRRLRPAATEPDSAAEPGVNLGVARALDAMIERAHSLIGTPYRNGGNSPETGFDCSGLAGYLYRDILGFQLPRSAHQIWKFGKTVEREDLRPGDLVFYNTLKRPYSHVGIYLGDNRFIHSPTSGGQVNIVDMNQRYWAARWNGAKRVVP